MASEPHSTDETEIRDVLYRLVKRVTKSEKESLEKETRGGRTTDLKIFIARNESFEIGQLNAELESLYKDEDGSRHISDYIDKHAFEENEHMDGISVVRISTPRYNRTDEFILVDRDNYLWILTTARKVWTSRTIERLIDYLPSTEQIFLSPEDIVEMTTEELRGSTISGFTAKNRSEYKNKSKTVRVHGAEEGDIGSIKNALGARPSRVEFNQSNSPARTVQGAQTNTGSMSIESVLEGYEQAAVDTVLDLSHTSEERDRERYEIGSEVKKSSAQNGYTINNHTSIELQNPQGWDELGEDYDLAQRIEQDILSKQQYGYGIWDEDTFFVHDKKHGEVFELGVESPDIVLHARETTTSLSLRSFCQTMVREFESSYDIDKMSVQVGP